MAAHNTQSYTKQKERLEEIVLQIRSKEVPLEKSLDLYDEALAIGTRCVEKLEQTDFTAEERESAAEHPELAISGTVSE
ncbi:MAG: exodeoxyribonuclease VII small subunit [Coriobacteriales bacterium]|jgi:exodeoxyribonuclease VII small subunit|nr:exodeoxyribonuclease VII small subunit [Coriobacteriales bacterium]